MNRESEKRFRIVVNAVEAHMYSLLDSSDGIVKIDVRPSVLAAYALDVLDADEVRHDYDLVNAATLHALRRP